MITVPYVEYINVRIRSRFRKLIDRDTYESLIAGDDLGVLTTFLLGHEDYGPVIEHALHDLPEREGLERGVMNYFCQRISAIINMSEGGLRRKLELAVHQFDLRNLRSVMVARHHQYEFARIHDMLIPCGVLNQRRLEKLYASPDIPGMVGMLETWYPIGAYSLRRATDKKEIDGTLVGLLNSMEQHASRFLLSQLHQSFEDDRILADLLRFEIDMKNILVALKHVWAGMDHGDRRDTFIHGGNIRKSVLADMIGKKDIDDVFEMIESTPFHTAIERGIIYYAETGLLNDMEHFFEEVFIRRAQNFRRYQLFSIGVFVGYLWAQYAEMTNLRTIINGIAFHSGPGQIKKGLVYV